MFGNKSPRLLGIGNAATDVVCNVQSDEDLKNFGLIKGQCVFLDDKNVQELFSKLSIYDVQYLPGGSAANVVTTFAALGGRAEFVGKISDDECGQIFKNSMIEQDVDYSTASVDDPNLVSTQIFTLVTPDGERSFAACYGASHYISRDDIDINKVSHSSLLLLDGYMLMSENGPDVLMHSIDLAQKCGRDVVFMPADLSVIEARPEQTRDIMRAAQSVICNLEQAQALTGLEDIDDILDYLMQNFEFGCVTDGANGVYAFQDGQKIAVSNPYQPQEIVSTNGAGDNFAGGFLYGVLHHLPLRMSCRLGMYCALECLKQQGSRAQQDLSHLLASAA